MHIQSNVELRMANSQLSTCLYESLLTKRGAQTTAKHENTPAQTHTLELIAADKKAGQKQQTTQQHNKNT